MALYHVSRSIGPQMFSQCIDAPKRATFYPKNIMLQFYVSCHENYYATLMLLEKLCYTKTNINFTVKSG